MTSTFQPCANCHGTNLQTREYPTLNGPMKRLCGLCFEDLQHEMADQFTREDAAKQVGVQRLAERVGALVFDVLCVSIIGGAAGVFFTRLVWGWPSW